MTALPKLINIYDSARLAVGKYFINEGYSSVDIKNSELANKYPNCEIYEKPFLYKNISVKIIVVLSKFFPDQFPKIFIDKLFYDQYFIAPHIGKDRSICTFDNFTYPNAKYPVEIVKETIKKAEKILEDIIEKKDLTSEYIDEITHYWNLETLGSINSLIEPGIEPCRVFIGQILNDDYFFVAASTMKEVFNWYINLGIDKKSVIISSGIYIPELNYGIPPFPVNNREWAKILGRQSNQVKIINDIADECSYPIILIFSKKGPNSITWGAVRFKKSFVIETNARKKRRVREYVCGFRNGHVPFMNALRAFPQNKVDRLSVEPVYSSRLQIRGGEGIRIKNNPSILLVGCGSIGSNLAELLVQIGIQKISLVDPDELTFANIARHVCGANNVWKNKAEALAFELGRRFPNVKYQASSENIFEILMRKCDWINKNDLVICAIGEYNAEMRINEAIVNGDIKVPVLFVWVEPFLAAGHAVYVAPSSSCFKCSLSGEFEDRSFVHKVLAPNQGFTKREAGCSSLYIPYGILKVKSFVSRLTDFILEEVLRKPKDSMIWTWIGDLDEMRDKEFRITKEWRTAKNHSTYTQRLIVKTGCGCRNVD